HPPGAAAPRLGAEGVFGRRHSANARLLPAKSQAGAMTARRVALKIDCDTLEGTREGVPRLVEILGKRGIRATFYFTLGPDRSGVAIRRIFTRKGFLTKMIRSRAPSLYGWRTMLYGTVLPAPRIGARTEEVLRAAARAGHETGVHGWDHVGWHDGLDR